MFVVLTLKSWDSDIKTASLHQFALQMQCLFDSYLCGLCGRWICCLPDSCKPLGGRHQTGPRRYTVPTRFCPAGSHSPELQMKTQTWSSASEEPTKHTLWSSCKLRRPAAVTEINKPLAQYLLNAELRHLTNWLKVANCKFRNTEVMNKRL